MNIILPSTYMKSDKYENTLLETECLFGETVEILDKYKNLVYCKLITDNYCGWVRKKVVWENIYKQHIGLLLKEHIFIKKRREI